MTYGNPRDQAVDDAAVAAFTKAYGERATTLPPVAIVIAAYNEAGAIGPVIEELPAEVCGLATTVIVVADGCADGTAKEAMTAGAMVADVPVNRGQGAGRRRGLHRDHRRRWPVQPGRDRAGTGPRGGRRGGLRDRVAPPGQPGDP